VALSPGQRLGRYDVLAPLGAGGMGEVYRARDGKLGRDVALKVLPAAYASDLERLKRFEQEARSIAALDHPNVLTVHDAGVEGGAPYMVTELLEGETLRAVLERGAVSPGRALELGAEVALGLAAAHAKGILHRDIKPENVFLTRDGRVKVLDFGLAKLRAEAWGRGPGNLTTEGLGTEPGVPLGTLGYMSPEQLRGQEVDERSDIFTLGVVLYEMLSGRSPFRRD
jgi:serine/threonine protein kinase